MKFLLIDYSSLFLLNEWLNISKGTPMKTKISYLICASVAFFFGMAVASLIIDQLRVMEIIKKLGNSSIFWESLSAIGTLLAVVTSLYLASSGARRERDNRIEEYWKIKTESASTTYHHLNRLGNIVSLLNTKEFLQTEFEREKYEELYMGWSTLFINEGMAGTTTAISNWEGEKIHEKVEIITQIFTLHFHEKKILDLERRREYWSSLNSLMIICQNIAFQYMHECYRKAEKHESAYDTVIDKRIFFREADKQIADSKRQALIALAKFKSTQP
ncbi:hypothetical protein [Marinomonas shanghaiensis]|uniref:hypothetical protein n=1 Tax=Marinomonas shanghaiensis TaxID=2202418 RepID=UPI003A9547C6